MFNATLVLPRRQTPSTGSTAPTVATTTERGTVVETTGLVKRYGQHTAVDGLDFRLDEGEIFGLLGPNGAGKTTTILMLMGLTEPTAGSVRVLGFDPVRQPLQVKRRVGYLPEHVALYDDLSARENLLYTADLNGIKTAEAKTRIQHALERVNLAAVADKKVRTFSHGMRQRLGIADVLIKQPRLVVLDEPTLGLDPEATQQLLDLIQTMTREEGLTVLLSSHQLQQVQRICHRVGIFVKGRMIAQGPISVLAEQLAGGLRTLEVGALADKAALADLLKGIKGVVSLEPHNGHWQVKATSDVRGEIARAIVERGWTLTHLRERDFGLEEIYLRYFEGG